MELKTWRDIEEKKTLLDLGIDTTVATQIMGNIIPNESVKKDDDEATTTSRPKRTKKEKKDDDGDEEQEEEEEEEEDEEEEDNGGIEEKQDEMVAMKKKDLVAKYRELEQKYDSIMDAAANFMNPEAENELDEQVVAGLQQVGILEEKIDHYRRAAYRAYKKLPSDREVTAEELEEVDDKKLFPQASQMVDEDMDSDDDEVNEDVDFNDDKDDEQSGGNDAEEEGDDDDVSRFQQSHNIQMDVSSDTVEAKKGKKRTR